MDAQLNRAYDLIKAGNVEEALAMLEPLIRENRNNEDAWWLYANAVTDPEAKRNALNNILRIGSSETRTAKVRYMLAQLDDPAVKPDDFVPRTLPQKRSSSNKKIIIGIFAVLGLFACIAIYALFSFASKMVYLPENYDDQGSVISGELLSGVVDTEGDRDGYTFVGEAGDQIVISLRPLDGEIAPFAFLYDSDGVYLALSNENEITVNRLRKTLAADGEYIIIVRTMFGYGEGGYTLNFNLIPAGN